MSIQEWIGTAGAAIGGVYALIMLVQIFKNRAELALAPGKLSVHMAVEFAVYFLGTMGISDFLLNTLAVGKMKTVEDRYLPDNLIACCIVPGTLTTYFYLKNGGSVELTTLLVFMGGLILGSLAGSCIVGKLQGGSVKKIMGICLILSMVFVVIKMIISAGVSGTATGFTGVKLIILGIVGFCTAFANMMGIPMKPTATAVLLIMGLSPITALTLVIVMGCVAPVSGGVRVVRSCMYNKKMVLSAVTAGSAAALLGTKLAVSVDPSALNIILLAVMGFAAFSLLRKPA